MWAGGRSEVFMLMLERNPWKLYFVSACDNAAQGARLLKGLDHF